jgi:hypothetical protein
MRPRFSLRFFIGKGALKENDVPLGCSDIEVNFDTRDIKVFLPAGLSSEQISQIMVLVEGAEAAGERIAGVEAAERFNLVRVIPRVPTESAPASL